jgi:fatty acid desaturase
MEIVVKKSDFVLTPYMKSNDLWATYQVLNTVIPYILLFLLWFLAVRSASTSLWLIPPIIVLITLFSLHCFSLMHDCGHYSLFSSKRVNRFVGFALGLINAMPQYAWSRDHVYHHKTNGDWERYRGVADFLSTEEFSKLNSFDQKLYEVLRHPLMAFPGGDFSTLDWDHLRGAIEGSSYLELPTILKWFSADIGFHNIHHLIVRLLNRSWIQNRVSSMELSWRKRLIKMLRFN